MRATRRIARIVLPRRPLADCDVLVVGGGITGCGDRPPSRGRGRRCGARRALRSEHAGLGLQRGQPARADPARPLPAARRGVGALVRARDAVPGRRDLALARAARASSAPISRSRIGGGLLVAETEAQLRDIERKVAIERAQGLRQSSCSSRDDLRRVAPYVSTRMAGGELCPVRGQGEPAARGTGARARRGAPRCARLLRHTELTALERAGAGFRAQTTAGEIQARPRRELRRGRRRPRDRHCSASSCPSSARRSRRA